MQSARQRSVMTAAIASMSPSIRPALTPARTPSGVVASTNDSRPSRWSSSSASIAEASSSSLAALNERSSNPSACIRFFV
jgi:hypothetical protein